MIRFLIRQSPLFLVVFCAGGLLTVAVILFAPRKYQSEAKLLLKVGRENVSLDPTVTTAGETISLHQTRDNEVSTALEMMQSRTILEQVVDTVGADTILRGTPPGEKKTKTSWLKKMKGQVAESLRSIDPIEDKERAILTLRDNLEIDAKRDSSVVNVSYQTKSAAVAQQVTECWVQSYLNAHAGMHASPGSLKFFEDESTALSDRLRAARKVLQDQKTSRQIVTIESEQSILEKQLQWSRTAIVENRSKLAAAKARLDALRKQYDDADETIVSSEAVSDSNEARNRMRDRLYALEIEERDLSAKLSKDHPDYRAIVEQLEEVRRVYNLQERRASEVTESINPLRVALSEQIATEIGHVEAYSAELNANTESLQRLCQELAQLNEHEAELSARKRDVEILEAEYRRHQIKHEQARFAAELESRKISNVNVIQEPAREQRPVSPNKKLCAILGFIGSVMAATGTVVLRNAIRSPKPPSRIGAAEAKETFVGVVHEAKPTRSIAATPR